MRTLRTVSSAIPSSRAILRRVAPRRVAFGVVALLASVLTVLVSAKIAFAGDTTLCRTYADAKYEGGYFVIAFVGASR